MRVRVLAVVLLGSLLVPLHVRGATPIPADARIFISSGGGFDMYLSAALERRRVPLTITTDRSKADYVVEAGRVVNARSGDVVFVWSDNGKSADSRQNAETCARRLAQNVQTPPKHKSVAKDPIWQF